jgi:hypothetical protein
MKFFKWISDLVSWAKEQVEWFKSFFGEIDSIDNSKKPSIKKLGTAIIFFVFARAYIATTWRTGKLEDIPENWMITLLLILGIGTVGNIFAAKQKGGTNEPPK